ncbi:MAG: DNA cytosine methyltransferase [Candidatus Paceibacterota bacterium]
MAWPEWNPVFFSEISPFPCSVLTGRYPDVPNYGDMTKYKEWPNATIDVLCAGTPCQSFSLAGLRKGLDDPRGNLTLTYLGIAERYSAEWLVWENVPGVLSDKTGAFETFLAGLAKLGYGFAYRVLNAQYYGVPQRRRRVILVGHFGDWRRAAAVLFERHSLQGYPPPGAPALEGITGDVAPSLTGSGRGTERTGESRRQDPVIACCSPLTTSPYGDNSSKESQLVPTTAHRLKGEGFDGSEDGTGGGIPLIAGCLQERDSKGADSNTKPGHLIPIALQSVNTPMNKKQNGLGISDEDIMYSCTARDQHGIQNGMQVRRLTPRECERLQGFPDDYTLVQHNGKPAADGPRYRAIGNSMAVPVMRWVGRRIKMVNKICKGNVKNG